MNNHSSSSKGTQWIKTFALTDPDFQGYLQQYDNDPLLQRDLPPDVIQSMVDLLELSPESQQKMVQITTAQDASQSFDLPSIASIGTLVAVLFVLRTHIKISRNNGKWEFVIEHKPGDSALMQKVLAAVAKVLHSDT